MFSCKYGYFSNDGYEYKITNPRTPKPWSNIISNGNYSILVTQTGGGYSWGKNSIENRITRFVQDSILDDFGKYFYIRDEDTMDVWGFTYKPLDLCGDDYTVTYGIGYAIFTHTYNGIRSTLKVFLSKDDRVEFYLLELENLSDTYRRLSIFSYAELYLSNFPEENKEFDKLFMKSRFDTKLNSIIFNKTFWGVMDKYGHCNNREYGYIFFMTSLDEVVSYDTCKESFIGMYNSLKNPKSLNEKYLSNKSGKNFHMVSCIQIYLNLNPCDKKETSIYMGICESEAELRELLIKYKSIDDIIYEFVNFKNYMREFIDDEIISTPDKSIDFMVNIWCKYQTISCRFLGKGSYYQINKGIGFRDHLQDSMIFLNSKSELTRKQILEHGNMEFIDGRVIHYFLDESRCGLDTNSSDDHLWLVYITVIYINETSDFSILNENLGYLDSFIKESLYNHLKRSIEYSLKNLSDRGLSLILKHDWNDAISNFDGDSIFVSEFLYLILIEFKPICEIMGDLFFINKITYYSELLKNSINNFGFNSKWYLRGISSDIKIGCCDDDHRIFLLPQVFGVISDVCDDDRKIYIMDKVYELLNTEFGLKILDPPYDNLNKSIGYITRYAEGIRENGSIYYHSCMWGILAFILINRLDIAKEIVDNINPIKKNDKIDLYQIEPYVMPSSVEGDYSVNFGRGNWSFNTGSSVWFHRIITNFVIGVRGNIKGLLIDPKPFEDWNEFSIIKKYRGSKFNINFKRMKVNNLEIYVNGEKIIGNIIKDIKKNKEYNVEVYLKY